MARSLRFECVNLVFAHLILFSAVTALNETQSIVTSCFSLLYVYIITLTLIFTDTLAHARRAMHSQQFFPSISVERIDRLMNRFIGSETVSNKNQNCLHVFTIR